MDREVVGKVATLLTGFSALIGGCGPESSRPDGPTHDTSVSQSLSTTMPELINECEIKFLGVDPSKDMWSYLTKKHPKILNYTEIRDGVPSESRTAELCYSVYLSRKEELLKNGAKNTAYGTEDGQFTFAGNFGEKGNFVVSFTVESLPTETSSKFDNALEKLLEVLQDVDRSLSTDAMPELINEAKIESLGVDPSKDMMSHITEKYPEMKSYTEIGDAFESAAAKLCRIEYLDRREELLGKGVKNVAYGMTDEHFVIAVNGGEKGNFEATFDVDSNAGVTAARFADVLDQLSRMLDEIELNEVD